MSRTSSPFVIGDHWLDQRKDGRAKGVWQIASYNSATRSTDYRSTGERELARAKDAIRKYVLSLEATQPESEIAPPSPSIPPMIELWLSDFTLPSSPELDAGISDYFEVRRQRRVRAKKNSKPNPLAVPVAPHIFRYWEDHASKTQSARTTAGCLRDFLGFIQQDAVGVNCTFHDLGPKTIGRYRVWSLQPHQYEVDWYGKRYDSRSRGLGLSSFKKRRAALMAALNHAVEEGAVPYVRPMPKLPGATERKFHTRALSVEELGATVGYARSDRALLNWLLLMTATGCRPGAAMKMIPSEQFDASFGPRLNLHPKGWPESKKRNPIVPVIPAFADLIIGHHGPWLLNARPDQIKRRWKLLRDNLGFGPEVVSNTIRHTIASELGWRGAHPTQISELLGHSTEHDTMARYRLHRPTLMASVVPPLSDLWNEVQAEADRWCERYTVVKLSARRTGVARIKKAADPNEPRGRPEKPHIIPPRVLAIARKSTEVKSSILEEAEAERRALNNRTFFKNRRPN